MSNTNTPNNTQNNIEELPSYENYRNVSRPVPKQVSIYKWSFYIGYTPFDYAVIASNVDEARQEILSIFDQIDTKHEQWESLTDDPDAQQKLLDEIVNFYQGYNTLTPFDYTSEKVISYYVGRQYNEMPLRDFICTTEPNVSSYHKVFIISASDDFRIPMMFAN